MPNGYPADRITPGKMSPGLRIYLDRVGGELRATRNVGAALIATVERVVKVQHGADTKPLFGRSLYMIHTDLGVVAFQAPGRTFGLAPMPGNESPTTLGDALKAHEAYLEAAKQAASAKPKVKARDRWSISSTSGMGSFLCPPGHPAHRFEVIQGPARNPQTSMSVDAAARGEYGVPDEIRDRAAAKIAEATLVESELWLHMVYGYFRGCYVPEGATAVDTRHIITGVPDLPDERSAAVVAVRRWFPGHEPREDLLEAAHRGEKLYGSHPCRHCGERVQYEAAVDKLAVFDRRGRGGEKCADAPDGVHAW